MNALTALFNQFCSAFVPAQSLDFVGNRTPEILPGLRSLHLDSEACVLETIYPGQSGAILFQGCWWSARCPQDFTIPHQAVVQVVGRSGNTLLVRPCSSGS